VRLGDDFWDSWESGPLGDGLWLDVTRSTATVHPVGTDQRGNPRPSGPFGDVGAIER